MNEAVKYISVREFLNLTQAVNSGLVIDVRTAAEVNSEYLDGCVNIPLHELNLSKLESVIVEKAAEEKTVYLLCGSGQRAERAARQFMGEVANPLVVIEGGINAIKQTGSCLKKGTGSVISLERQVRIAAGTLVLFGVLLGVFLSPIFYGLSAFVGAGLIFAGITGTCGMGMLLARMPWNRVGSAS